MKAYLRTIFFFAKTQIRRSLRDPMTLLVLFAIPLLLLLVFGAFLRDTSNISLRVAVINNSDQPFADQFANSLNEVSVLKLPENAPSLDEARQQMHDNELDGIIELPENFGAIEGATPTGEVKVYYDQTDTQTGEIVSSVMRSVVEATNQQLTDVRMPITISQEAVNVNQVTAIDSIFATFTGIAIMMVGVFGVASVIPYDKKGGYLRRLHATPLRPSQFMLGTMINYSLIGLSVVTLMTILALFVFDLNMRGSWIAFAGFVAAALTMMLGFGLAVGGIAKNTTQADILGQVIFLSSMAVGGVWLPTALLPSFVQTISSFIPLTPIVDGIRAITTEGVGLTGLGPELAVIGGWALIAFIVGIKTFRWE